MNGLRSSTNKRRENEVAQRAHTQPLQYATVNIARPVAGGGVRESEREGVAAVTGVYT